MSFLKMGHLVPWMIIYIYDPIKHYSSPLFHAEYDDEAPVDLDKGIGHQER
jgi:hypothetical protein